MPSLKQHLLTVQCDRCGREHILSTDPQDLAAGEGPEGWIIIKVNGFSTDAIFETVLCNLDECREPILKALGFESYAAYYDVVKADEFGRVPGGLPRGEYEQKSHALTRSILEWSGIGEDDDDPKVIDTLLQAIDDEKDPWDVN